MQEKNKYTCLVIDPPWSFSDQLKHSKVKRGASSNYTTMMLDDIKKLQIKEISSLSGAILCLWVPSSLLQEGLDVMRVWGFNHRQTFIWIKNKKNTNIVNDMRKDISQLVKKISNKVLNRDGSPITLKDFNFILDHNILNFGLGRIFRQSHEICLIGINNNGIYKKLKNKSQRSVCFAENLRHSEKPECLQNSLELMFPGDDIKKVEIFARRVRPGWRCLGNEIDYRDIREVLAEIINS